MVLSANSAVPPYGSVLPFWSFRFVSDCPAAPARRIVLRISDFSPLSPSTPPPSTPDLNLPLPLPHGHDPHQEALATVIKLLDADVIVLGGGLSNIESLYTRVPLLWSDWVCSDRGDTRLARATHGDSSGVRGAAWLWPQG